MCPVGSPADRRHAARGLWSNLPAYHSPACCLPVPLRRFVCPTEIIAFSDRAKEFEALNCQVSS